jgi:polyisoprenoid-binding protein YceI
MIFELERIGINDSVSKHYFTYLCKHQIVSIMKKDNKWEIDLSHSSISFSVTHLLISKVKGSFARFDGSIYTREKDFTKLEIDLQIEVNSISTGDEKRDEHLRGKEFFDVDRYSQISFSANEMGQLNDSGQHELWGDLTMKDVTKRIILYVEPAKIIKDLQGKERAGFNITGKIDRTDWGLEWNQVLESGGLLVSREVNIECDIQLINMNQEELIMDLDSNDDTYAKPL